ncbi:hypothetical protein Tco_1465872 [Tanacetum coccineum]
MSSSSSIPPIERKCWLPLMMLTSGPVQTLLDDLVFAPWFKNTRIVAHIARIIALHLKFRIMVPNERPSHIALALYRICVMLAMKTGIKHCKRWHWFDPELENKRYIAHLYEMHLLLNPSQRKELENEVRSQEALADLQVEFVDMEGQMQQEKSKNDFFKSTVIVFGIMAWFMFVMN